MAHLDPLPGGRFQQPLHATALNTQREIMFSSLKKLELAKYMMQTISHGITVLHFKQDLTLAFLDFPSVGWERVQETLCMRERNYFCLLFPTNPLRPMENHLLVPSVAVGIRRVEWMNARPNSSTAWRAGAATMLERLLIHPTVSHRYGESSFFLEAHL